MPGLREVDVVEIRDARVVRQELVEDRQQRAPELVDVDARVQPQQQRFKARIVERRPGSRASSIHARAAFLPPQTGMPP